MDYTIEEFNFEESFPFIMFETDLKQMYMHSHNFLEINLILAGNGYYVIEEKRYDIHEGDIFIINNQERHMAIHNEKLKILVIIFEASFVWNSKQVYDFLEPFFNRGPQFSNSIRKNQNKTLGLYKYLDDMMKEYNEKKFGWQMFVKANTMMFLAELFRYCHENEELGGDVKNLHNVYSKIRPALDFIHENYMEKIDLESLAKHTMMNKSYLCTCFKETMKIRIFEYIDQLRINQACFLLKTTDRSITDISYEIGFNSVSYFNRTFKKVQGVSPSIYRKNQTAKIQI